MTDKTCPAGGGVVGAVCAAQAGRSAYLIKIGIGFGAYYEFRNPRPLGLIPHAETTFWGEPPSAVAPPSSAAKEGSRFQINSAAGAENRRAVSACLRHSGTQELRHFPMRNAE